MQNKSLPKSINSPISFFSRLICRHSLLLLIKIWKSWELLLLVPEGKCCLQSQVNNTDYHLLIFKYRLYSHLSCVFIVGKGSCKDWKVRILVHRDHTGLHLIRRLLKPGFIELSHYCVRFQLHTAVSSFKVRAW